jgi:hypothetical protein
VTSSSLDQATQTSLSYNEMRNEAVKHTDLQGAPGTRQLDGHEEKQKAAESQGQQSSTWIHTKNGHVAREEFHPRQISSFAGA